jgi:hypothetical protein
VLKICGETEAGHRLKAAFKRAKSPVVSANIFVTCARTLRGSGDDPLITPAGFEALGKILLPKLVKAAKNGSLTKAPSYGAIARAWKQLGGATAAKAWLNANMDASADFLSKLTDDLVAHSISTPEPEYQMLDLPDPELYDLDALLSASRKHLAGNELTRDARTASK